MLTINTILNEINDVPVSRLQELYQFIHTLTPNKIQDETKREKILLYGGVFNDMSSKDYTDYLSYTKNMRTKFFDRTFEL